MSDTFLREVEEEVRREQYDKLWAKYGKYVWGLVAAVMLIGIGTAVIVEWRHQTRMADVERFMTAMKLGGEGKKAEAEAIFAAIARDGHAGIPTLAKFREAALVAGRGEVESAIKMYDALAADSALDRIYRDLAALQAAVLLFDKGSSDDVAVRLAALDRPDGPYRWSAAEMIAVNLIRNGKLAEARQPLTKIVADMDTPEGIRRRASDLLASLGPAPALPPAAAPTAAAPAPAAPAASAPAAKPSDSAPAPAGGAKP